MAPTSTTTESETFQTHKMHGNNGCHFLYQCLNNRTLFVSHSKQLSYIERRVIKCGCVYPNYIKDMCIVQSLKGCESYTLTESALWRTDIFVAIAQSLNNATPGLEQDIFTDLLSGEDGVHPSRSDDPCAFPCGERVLDKTMCGPGSISSVARVSNMVVTLQRTPADWILSIFESRGRKTLKPLRTVLVGKLGDEPCDPGLLVAVPQRFADKNNCRSNKHIVMSTELFQHFLKTSKDDDEPVALLTSTEGIIYAAPLKSESLVKAAAVMDFGERIVFLNCLNVSLKFVQGDPKIVFSPEAAGNCLVIIGCYGNIELRIATASEPTIFRGTLVGPVTAAAIYKNILVHSTGRDTYNTDLGHLLLTLLESSASDSQQVTMETKSSLKSQPMGVCSVVAMAFDVSKQSTKDTISEAAVTLLTCRGRIIHNTAHTKPKDSHMSPSAKITTAMGGARIKDLLTGITQVSDMLSEVKGQLTDQDTVLHQLHIAGILLSGSGSGSRRDTLTRDAGPIKVTWAFDVTDQGLRKETVSYQVEFKIQVAVDLAAGWFVNVSGSSQGVDTITKSVHIGDSRAGDEFEVSLNCDNLVGKASSLLISGNVVYNLQGKDNNALCIPLAHRVLDILYTLTPVKPSKSLEASRESAAIYRLAKTRQCYASHPEGTTAVAAHREGTTSKYSAKIITDAGHLETLRIQKNLRSPDPRRLLAWLLRHSPQLCVLASQSQYDYVSVTASAPGTLSARLHTHLVTLSARYTPGDSSRLEIGLQTDTVTVLGKLEQAVRNRLKMPQDIEPKTTPSNAELRKMLNTIETLEQDLESVQQTHKEAKANKPALQIQQTLALYDRYVSAL